MDVKKKVPGKPIIWSMVVILGNSATMITLRKSTHGLPFLSFMSKGLCMAELQYKCLCICRQLCFVICHETSNSYLQILSERLIWQQIMQGHAETVVGTKNCAVLHAVKMALWQVYSVIQFNSFSYWNCGVLAFWIRSTIECS